MGTCPPQTPPKTIKEPYTTKKKVFFFFLVFVTPTVFSKVFPQKKAIWGGVHPPPPPPPPGKNGEGGFVGTNVVTAPQETILDKRGSSPKTKKKGFFHHFECKRVALGGPNCPTTGEKRNWHGGKTGKGLGTVG